MIDSILACTTCANNFITDDNAAGYAILFMLGVLLPILGGIGFLMVRIIRRGESSLDPELSDDFSS
jgi:hypothetical protein